MYSNLFAFPFGEGEKAMGLGEISPEELYDLIVGAEIPDAESYETRDKKKGYFRHYQAESNKVLILLHGVSEDGKYLFRLAQHLTSINLAQVYTPDLRGYGSNAERRGDVDYIGQIEDDLADLIHFVKEKHENASIILGGHSLGGGSVLCFAGSQYAKLVDAYLFLAPYIHPNAPMIRKSDDGGNSNVSLAKLIFLSLLEKIKIRSFHHRNVLTVNKPAEIQHGSETLALSFRLVMSRIPQKYQEYIKSLSKPVLVLVGENDELFYPEKFEPVFSQNGKTKTVVIPRYNHDGILFGDEALTEVEDWLKSL